ncbi:hypothetical protein H7849_06880 [Alloacidobacterium dinghuense]|uniref:Uncharacterized protein n=1 Tax=Alloacidobacterium dinghuense TaxID=2763107 RepID=A0A7G8BM78_9BACT|nr:hypothetical protein [Alloacidobacterium dinghuense]QNI33648.1 hypothetical protein H7849_06880 [Alloacidobacterium dinghuense]
MSEIQTLTERIRELSGAVDFWNVVMLWGLGIAAFAAVLIVISTRLIVVRTGQQSSAQGLLDAAKDRQLEADLKAKDLKIAELKDSTAILENENLRVKQQLSQQGHRSALLLASQKQFGNAMKGFSGQKFELAVCPSLLNDWEVNNFKMVLWATLNHNAGWAWISPEREIGVCTDGLGIFVRSTAPPHTKEAAQALSLNLDKVLGKRMVGKISAGQVGFAVTTRPNPPAVLGEESSSDDVILIHVGAHP